MIFRAMISAHPKGLHERAQDERVVFIGMIEKRQPQPQPRFSGAEFRIDAAYRAGGTRRQGR